MLQKRRIFRTEYEGRDAAREPRPPDTGQPLHQRGGWRRPWRRRPSRDAGPAGCPPAAATFTPSASRLATRQPRSTCSLSAPGRSGCPRLSNCPATASRWRSSTRRSEATLIRAGAMGHSSRVVEHFRRWGRPAADPRRVDVPARVESRHQARHLARRARPGGRRPPPASPSDARRGTRSRDRIRRPQTALQQVFLRHLGRARRQRDRRLAASRRCTRADGGIEVEVAERRLRRTADASAARYVHRRRRWQQHRPAAGRHRARRGARDREAAAADRPHRRRSPSGSGPAPSGTNIVFNAKA